MHPYGNTITNPGSTFGGASFIGAPETPVGPPQAIAVARDSVNSALQEVARLTEQAGMIADQMFGAMPPATGKQEGQNVASSGAVGGLAFELQVLHSAIASLRRQIERLSCL